MFINKKIVLASTLTLSLFAASHAKADEQDGIWTARTVEEVKANLIEENNSVTYTIQYGDTLSSIAEAMEIDLAVLTQINQIANVDLIFPNTVLKTVYDQNHQATSVEISVPTENPLQNEVVATADLASQQVVMQDQVVDLKPISEAVSEQAVASSAPATTALANSEQVSSEQAQISEVATSEAVSVTSDSSTVASLTADIVNQNPVSEYVASSEVAPASITASSEAVTSEEAASVTSDSSTVASLTADIVNQTPASEYVASSEVALASATASSEAVTSEEAASATSDSSTVASLTADIVNQTPASEYVASSEVVHSEAQPVSEVATVTSEAAAPSQTNVAVNSTGLQPVAASFQQAVANQFGISDIGGYRPGDPQDHGQGLAVDVMVPVGSDLGDQVAQYAIDNMVSANISYIIWEQQFYAPVNNIYGPANTWNLMPDRGSVTENHYDHVHISFNG